MQLALQSHQQSTEPPTVYRGKHIILLYFHCSYLKVNIMKVQGKLNMHVIFESVLMLLTEIYQNRSMIVKATAGQSWHIFFRHSVVRHIWSIELRHF